MLEINLRDAVNDSEFHMEATPTTLLCVVWNGAIFAVSCGKL